MTKELNNKKVEGLCLYIMELDSLRIPIKFGIYPYSLNMYLEFLFKNKERNLVKKDKIFYQKTVENMKSYHTDTEVSSKELTILFSSLIAVLMFLGLGSALISIIISLNFLQGVIFLIIMAIPTFYLYFAWMGTRRRNFLGNKHDDQIKYTIQLIIEYRNELIKKENLNPEDFPIKLKHNDYENLICKKQGPNDYIGYFK